MTVAALKADTLRIGGLRRRAITAALGMVEAGGAEAVNLRGLARELGTGQASLYYHFASKDALMAELAVEGFQRLAKVFDAALRDPAGRSALHACGEGYLRFAREHPSLYRLMYADSLLAGHAPVRAAEAAAFRVFARGVSATEPDDETLEDRAMALWAFGRGVAAVTLDATDGGAPAREMVRQMVRGLESLMGRSIRRRPGD